MTPIQLSLEDRPITEAPPSAIDGMTVAELRDRLASPHYRRTLGRCPVCNSNIEDRTVSLYKELITALYHVYCWCGRHGCHEFETKDIKDLLGKNEYARFGDLVRFGGIVYKPQLDGETRKAFYGINMARARAFFRGEYEIPVQIVLNQVTNEIESATYVKVDQFPSLKQLLDAQGLYDYELTARAA